ncbi:MAG: N-acetyltransferase family protein [Rhizobiaceae bacterium]
MQIRQARPDDIPAITEIYGRSVVEEFVSFEHQPPSVAEMTSRMAALIDAGYPYLVAELDGEIAGYCYASSYRPRPAYSKTVESTVYVAPKFWRQGVASRLLDSLIEQCRARQYRQMIAIAACQGDANLQEVASVQLHHRLGFATSGRLTGVGYKHNQWLDIVLMQLTL